MAKGKAYETHAIGRRKTAVARVYLAQGTGKVTVNKRDIRNFFKQETNLYVVNQPLNLTKLAEKYDFNINVAGGGISGQAGAIRLGIQL
jgi:small subunit ribosomal protein S9